MNFGSGYWPAFRIQHTALNCSSAGRAVLVNVLRPNYAVRDDNHDPGCKSYLPLFHINVLMEKALYPGPIVTPHLRSQNCDEYYMCSRLVARPHALPDTRTIWR